jgi:hypothetical protein
VSEGLLLLTSGTLLQTQTPLVLPSSPSLGRPMPRATLAESPEGLCSCVTRIRLHCRRICFCVIRNRFRGICLLASPRLASHPAKSCPHLPSQSQTTNGLIGEGAFLRMRGRESIMSLARSSGAARSPMRGRRRRRS